MSEATAAVPPAVTPPAPTSPQVHEARYVTPAPRSQHEDSGLGHTVRTMGIVALSFTLVGLIPCLGWINYLNFLFSPVTFVLSIVALASAKSESAKNSALIGLVLVILANCIGVVRLVLGGGCL